MPSRTPAQIYAAVIGAALVLGGVAGLFYSASFGAPGHTEEAFGLLRVNGYHDLVHLLTGALGLVVAGQVRAARSYAGVLGVVYLGVAIWGFALGAHGEILGILPVNVEDDVLHVALGGLGLAAWLASHEKAPTAARLV